MRNAVRFLIGMSASAGVCGLALAIACPSAGAAPIRVEKQLLGIRILQSYKVVLARYGQPNRILRANEEVQTVDAIDVKGNPTGGIKGIDPGAVQLAGNTRGGGMMGGPGMMGGGMSNMGMGGRMAGMPGMPGMSGMPPGMSGGPPMMGMGQTNMGMGAYGAPPGYGARGGAMVGAGKGEDGGAAAPAMGMGNRRFGGGGMSNASMSGGGDAEDEGGFKWIYFYPREELLYEFTFNKDGRVTKITERGRVNLGRSQTVSTRKGKARVVRSDNSRTSRGIGLSSPLGSVYSSYEWPATADMSGSYLSLNYLPTHHAHFQLLNNRVVGITIALKEDAVVDGASPNLAMNRGAGMMGGPGMGGRGMMGGGMPGMPGRPPSGPGGRSGGAVMSTAD